MHPKDCTNSKNPTHEKTILPWERKGSKANQEEKTKHQSENKIYFLTVNSQIGSALSHVMWC